MILRQWKREYSNSLHLKECEFRIPDSGFQIPYFTQTLQKHGG